MSTQRWLGLLLAAVPFLLVSILKLSPFLRNLMGMVFAFGLGVLLASLNKQGSFISLIASRDYRLATRIFAYSLGLGICYELIGQFWLGL